jgi:hypothetical protein
MYDILFLYFCTLVITDFFEFKIWKELILLNLKVPMLVRKEIVQALRQAYSGGNRSTNSIEQHQ